MNFFISYSNQDSAWVKLLAAALLLRPEVDQVYWWGGSNVPGKGLWESIFGWIDDRSGPLKLDSVLEVIST